MVEPVERRIREDEIDLVLGRPRLDLAHLELDLSEVCFRLRDHLDRRIHSDHPRLRPSRADLLREVARSTPQVEDDAGVDVGDAGEQLQTGS